MQSKKSLNDKQVLKEFHINIDTHLFTQVNANIKFPLPVKNEIRSEVQSIIINQEADNAIGEEDKLKYWFNTWRNNVSNRNEISEAKLKALTFYEVIEGMVNNVMHKRFLIWNYTVFLKDNPHAIRKRILGRGLNVLENLLTNYH